MTFVFEFILFATAIAAFVAACVLCHRYHGWARVAWSLVALAWMWIVIGELILAITGSTTFIFRWVRAVPVRTLMALAFWLLVWIGRKRN